jgi:hypothetical protein
MNSPFVIKVTFGEYCHILCDVYCVKRALKYRRNIPVSVMSEDTYHILPNHTASHHRRWQASQTPLSKQQGTIQKPVYISGLHSKSLRHLNDNLQSESHKLYGSHVISSYYANRRKLEFPPPCRNTLIYTHMNSDIVLTYSINLDWILLPLAEVSILVELILIYHNLRLFV